MYFPKGGVSVIKIGSDWLVESVSLGTDLSCSVDQVYMRIDAYQVEFALDREVNPKCKFLSSLCSSQQSTPAAAAVSPESSPRHRTVVAAPSHPRTEARRRSLEHNRSSPSFSGHPSRLRSHSHRSRKSCCAPSIPPSHIAFSPYWGGSNKFLTTKGNKIWTRRCGIGGKMRVIQKFFIASMFMWAVPMAILYAFNHNLLPGTDNLSPYSVTLVSGFLAVISVNVVIAFYIYLAMREPADKHEPDPKFLAEAKASINQSTGDAQQSSQALKKEQ
ncbi:Vacuolar ATPase assembly integral membrane protein Vma21 [Sesbania bispinosa]|nr:Vacuolar ATPase assembly integral membrane protein Vma21 [Sesbania bispinosa]